MTGKIVVRTSLTDDFKVVQDIGDPAGEVIRRVVDVVAAQADAKFREGLIALGWVSPEEAELLRDLAYRYEELQK